MEKIFMYFLAEIFNNSDISILIFFGIILFLFIGALYLHNFSRKNNKKELDEARFSNLSKRDEEEVKEVKREVKKERPKKILFGISNQEIRQQMIKDNGGFENLIKKVDHDIIHTDDFGTLFRVLYKERNQFYYFVKVINGTPEPDGSYREYYLEVPPDMDTAKEAVAWTYGLHPDDYDIAIRT